MRKLLLMLGAEEQNGGVPMWIKCLLSPIMRSFFLQLDPEIAHNLAISCLKTGFLPGGTRDVDPKLSVRAFGYRFSHPLGLAAGFDKDAEVPDALLKLGFSFVEVGGVTPLPQLGNALPRVFRLSEDEAIINRYGLNSCGMKSVQKRLAIRKKHHQGFLGVNIAPNQGSADWVKDYGTLIQGLIAYVDYFSLNISSPNTPGLRNLQHRDPLGRLLSYVMEVRESCPHNSQKPVLIKLSPDMSLQALDESLKICSHYKVDGLIIANTTIERPLSLKDKQANQSGGLSGVPLFNLSTYMLAQVYQRIGSEIPLIGVGGINSAQTAFAKITAGASLLQIYSSLIYKGIEVIDKITLGLAELLRHHGYNNIQEAVGVQAKDFCKENLPM